MTIQENIQKKAEGFGKLAPVFLEGANFALNNMYINYQEQKPPIGVEVIAYHHKWVDEDFNPNGTRIGFLSDDEFINPVISINFSKLNTNHTICIASRIQTTFNNFMLFFITSQLRI